MHIKNVKWDLLYLFFVVLFRVTEMWQSEPVWIDLLVGISGMLVLVDVVRKMRK